MKCFGVDSDADLDEVLPNRNKFAEKLTTNQIFSGVCRQPGGIAPGPAKQCVNKGGACSVQADCCKRECLTVCITLGSDLYGVGLSQQFCFSFLCGTLRTHSLLPLLGFSRKETHLQKQKVRHRLCEQRKGVCEISRLLQRWKDDHLQKQKVFQVQQEGEMCLSKAQCCSGKCFKKKCK
jgi:hypothetical protein